MSAEIRLPFGLSNDGRMVTIDAVMRGLQCDCVCPQCHKPLVAAKGEILRHHFRHTASTTLCVAARETALHRYAKQVICDHLRLSLPEGEGTLGQIKSALAEKTLGDIRPDVLVEFDTEPVAVEIFVAHRVPQEKIEKFETSQLAALEIDLSRWAWADYDEDGWIEIILHRASRDWLYPPRPVRDERNRIRQEREERLRLEREEMLRQWEQASKERAEAERKRLELLNHQIAEEARLQIERETLAAQSREKDLAFQHEMLIEQENRAKLARMRSEAARMKIKRLRQDFTPPDLQELVRIHQYYSAIPPEAWAQYDEDMKRWKELIRSGARYYN